MTAARRLRRVLRVLALCLCAVLATICVLAAAAGLYLSTARGKDRLLRAVVTELNQVLPGRITVRRIRQLGPTSLVLEGVVLTAPAGNEVLAVEHARAEIALRPLLDGRIVLPLLALENGEADLRRLTHPSAGLLAAITPPGASESAPVAPAPPDAEPGFVIGVLSLSDWRLRLPQAEAWTPSELWIHALQARVSVGSAVEVEVERLDTELGRNGVTLGAMALRGQWSSQADSRVELAGSLCETELVLDLKLGRFPPALGDWHDVPVDLRLQLRGLSAARLARLALDPQLEPLFLGTVNANLRVQGTARQLSAQGELELDAGRIAFNAEARALSELDLTLDTEQLELRRLLSAAPDWRLGTRSKLSLALRPGGSAIGLTLGSQIVLNQIALPALQLRAELEPSALRRIDLQLDDRWLALSAAGELDFEGAAQLSGRARLDLDGARSWLRAFAQGRALEQQLGAAHGNLQLELALRRTPSGALSAQAKLRSPALELGGARLQQLAAALAFAGAPRQPALSLDASWAALSRGPIALTRGELHVGGGPEHYGFELKTGTLSWGNVAASGWLEPGTRESRFLVAGSGELRGARWRLSMQPARSDGVSELVLPDVRLVFADQEARLHGQYSKRACQLTLEFTRVDLQRVLTPFAPQQARAGVLSGKLVARGAPEHPELELELTGDRLELLPAAKLDANLSAQLDTANGALELQAHVHDDAAPSGPRLDLVWRASDDHTGGLGTELTLADAAGPWIHARAELALPHVPRAGSSLAQLLAAVPAALPQLLERERWQLELSAARRRLGQLPLPASWAALGELELDAQLVAQHQPHGEPQGKLEFELSDPTPRRQAATCSAGAFTSKGSLALHAGRFDAALRVESNQTPLLRLSSSGALDLFALWHDPSSRLPVITLDLDAQRLPLAQLPFLCERARGELSSSGHVSDPFGKGLAELQVQLRRFSLGSDQTVDVAAELSASPTAIAWTGTLTAAEGSSRFTGKLQRAPSSSPRPEAEPPIEVSLALDQLPLAPFFPLQGPISHVSGSLSGELHARGSAPTPDLSGSLQLHDIAFTVTDLAQPLSDINGELSLEKDALVLHQLTASDTAGTLALDGRLNLRSPREFEAGLNLNAHKFPLRQSGQVVARTSANARIDLDWTPAQQDLRIALRALEIWLESERAPEGLSVEPHPDVVVRHARGGAVAGLAALAEEEAARARLEAPNRMLVQIQSEAGFWVRRADFDLKLGTDLKIAIERPAPKKDGSGVTVTGEIRLERGYMELLGKMFEVQPGGTLRFPGSTSATLDLVASYKDRRSDRIVKVHLRGTASAPQLDFLLDDNPISAGEAFQAIYGSADTSSDRVEDTEAEASQILSAVTAGVITTSIRRRFGSMAPIVAVDPGGSQGVSQVRAGFELDTLIPDFLRDVVTGVYVEGIISSEKQDEQGTQRDVQPGVLIELHFPYNLVTSGRYGPDTTWTVDISWQH